MSQFEGFSREAVDCLWEIRLNNNREWYEANKARYKALVHEPMVAMGDELFAFFKTLDNDFKGYPKVSRITRDTRFTKNKDPYKESKWIMFREDQSPGIQHFRPTYFFEISPDWYRFGLGFWSSPKGMGNFRKRINANPAEAERLIAQVEDQDLIQLEDGDYYKRMDASHLPEKAGDWYRRKSITYIATLPYDDLFFTPELPGLVKKGFETLFPVHQYFYEISEMNTEAK